MSRTSIIAILACAGVVFTGEITSEVYAFARVVQSGDPVLLQRFAQQNPQSRFAPAAIQLASCNTNWVGGSCSNPTITPSSSGGNNRNPTPPVTVPSGGGGGGSVATYS